MGEYISESPEETKKIGEELAKRLKAGDTVAFFGGLGAGKTVFTTGLVKGLGVECDVTSPTFTICNEYIGNGKKILHYDMYRIETWDDLYSTAYFDNVGTDAYIIAEWAENIYEALPEGCYIVKIEPVADTKRKITVSKKGEEPC